MPPAPTVGLGWLRGTVRGSEVGTILDTLAGFVGPHRERPGGTRWYSRSASLSDGQALVAWDGVGQAAGTVLVDVHQAALDGLGWERGLELARALLGLGWRPSRLDLYLDDRQVVATPGDVWAALCEGQAVTHARAWRRHEDQDGLATAYVGERDSLRMLRVYRKPDGAGDRVRWEIELHDEAARSGLAALIAWASGRDRNAPAAPHVHARLTTGQRSDPAPLDATAGAFVLGLVADFVDFRATNAGDGHGSRRARLAWWSALLGSASRVRLSLGERVDSFERRARWLARQVAPTLSEAWVRLGDGWLNGVLRDGLDRAEATGRLAACVS